MKINFLLISYFYITENITVNMQTHFYIRNFDTNNANYEKISTELYRVIDVSQLWQKSNVEWSARKMEKIQ